MGDDLQNTLIRRVWRLLLALVIIAHPSPIAASEFDPLEELYARPTSLTIPPTRLPPQIDGKIDATEWDCASAVTGFYSYNTGEVLDHGPTLFLTYDKKCVYALFLVPAPEDRELIARVRERDGKVYTDDSVEMFFYTPNKDLFQIVVNSVGALSDFKNGNITWNGAFTVKAGKAESNALPASWGLIDQKYWFVEAAIPFNELGVTSVKEGDGWLVNFAVNRPTPWAVLAPIAGGSYSETGRFCSLKWLDPETPYAQITSLGNLRFGEVDVRGKLFNPGPKPASLVLDIDLRKKGSYLTHDAYRNVVGVIQSVSQPFSLKPGERAPFSVKKSVTDTSVNQMAFHAHTTEPAGKAATTLIARSGPVKIEPPLSLKVGNVPSKKYIVVDIDATSLRSRMQSDTMDLTIETLDKTGKTVLSKKVVATAGPAEATLDYGSLPFGSYICRVTASSAGMKSETGEASFNHTPPPAWLTSALYDDYGKTNRVPLPWTPLKYGKKQVSVWGRTMTWNKESLLPSSIRSQGTELLKRPMQMIVTIGGKRYPVPLNRFRFTGQQPNKGALVAQGATQGITVTADVWIEYDGFLWVELKVADSKKGRKVDALHIIAPLDARQTTLYQTFCRPLTGWIGDKPIKLPWLSDPGSNTVNFYHWFGNEDKGLGFTYTTLEHWNPESEDNFCTVARQADPDASGLYRMNLVEKPTAVDGRTYKFGIQATPIKPLPPDYHSMMAASLQYAPWKAWWQIPENVDMVLDWPSPNGVAMKGLQDPYHINATAMTCNTKTVHDKGTAFLGVASCPQKFCPLNDEFDDYHREWEALPESILNWDGVPHYQNCGHSYTLRKWLFYGWAVENVQKFGLEGLYYDGWQSGTMACSNPHHGCGWVDEKGKRYPTVPVLEGREFNQRMILFLEDHVKGLRPKAAPERNGFPRYHYWIHSWEFVPSVMGFATEWLTGEFSGWPLQGPGMLTPEGTYGKCLGLGLFRSRCLSTNWGVPNLFDALMWEHTENHPTDKQTLIAYAWFLPHGVPIGMIEYPNQKTVVALSKIMMDFGARKANFTPGWRKNPYLVIEKPTVTQTAPVTSRSNIVSQSDPDASGRYNEVMVATWDHRPEKKVLAVVSNLKVNETETVTLRWTGFAHPKMKDARTGESLKLEEGRLTMKLSPESFLLLRIEGK